MRKWVAVALMALCCVAKAEVAFERGVWRIAFDEADAKFSLSCPSRSIALTGRLTFTSGAGDGRGSGTSGVVAVVGLSCDR